MDVRAVQGVVDLVKADVGWFLETWYRVLTRGAEAHTVEALEEPGTLLASLRFAAYVSLLSLLLFVPVAASFKLPYDKPAFAISNLAVDLVMWTLYATVLHAAMRLCGGKGQYRTSLAIFFYGTAILVPAIVIQWPVQGTLLPYLVEGRFAGAELAQAMTPREAVTFFTCSLLAFAALVYLVWVVYGGLKRSHGLHGWAARAALVLGLAGMFAIMVVMGMPLHKMVYTAFD